MQTALPEIQTRHVAVIGAGAAGMAAARELRREGHVVVAFERGDQVGGIWVYTDQVDSDPLGVDPDRAIVHSSVYSSLRTNTPREAMGYKDYPFVPQPGKSRDPRRFPSHKEVLMYLKEFASKFEIEEMVRFETEVLNVKLVENGKWKVKSKKRGDCEIEEIYDAVVVCIGHFTEPRVADIPGVSTWPGKQMHCHNYRIPEPFRDQVVILIGSSDSAIDVFIDIAGVAKEVHIASRSVAEGTYEKQPGFDNIWRHSMVESAHEDGTVVFQNGRIVHADIILHCTGYKYHFPFLETNGIVTVDDNRVGPLYKHVFPPLLAPWLSFVGIPWKGPLFNMFEFQCKWIAGVLSGRIVLPSQEEMMDDIKVFYSTLEASGIPKRYTHNLNVSSWSEYNNWLTAQCGFPLFEEWRLQMYHEVYKNRRVRQQTFREEWEDNQLVLQAYEDFIKHNSDEAGNSCISQ